MSDTQPHDGVERRQNADCSNHEKRLIGVEHVTTDISKTMSQVVDKLDKILDKVNRIDILEEKHSTQQSDINRAHRKIEMLESAHSTEIDNIVKTVDILSVETRGFVSETKGMVKMAWYLWSVIGSTVFILLIKVLFFMGAQGATIG